jgi:hypothetical protein
VSCEACLEVISFQLAVIAARLKDRGDYFCQPGGNKKAGGA